MHSEDANALRGFRHSPSVPMVRQEGKLTLLPNEEEVDVVIRRGSTPDPHPGCIHAPARPHPWVGVGRGERVGEWMAG